MRPRTIIIDGEPIQIRRYRMERFDNKPMYEIHLLNFEHYSRFSVSVGVDLRRELEVSLMEMRGIESHRKWHEDHLRKTYEELFGEKPEF